jgi:hypothetical protein
MTHIQLGVYIFRSLRTDLARLLSLLGAAKPRWAEYAAYHDSRQTSENSPGGARFKPVFHGGLEVLTRASRPMWQVPPRRREAGSEALSTLSVFLRLTRSPKEGKRRLTKHCSLPQPMPRSTTRHTRSTAKTCSCGAKYTRMPVSNWTSPGCVRCVRSLSCLFIAAKLHRQMAHEAPKSTEVVHAEHQRGRRAVL